MPLTRRSRAFAAAAALGVAALARPAETQQSPANPVAIGVMPSASADLRVDPAPIEDAIQKLAAEVQRWGGTVGVSVVDVTTGGPIAALDVHHAFNPAS